MNRHDLELQLTHAAVEFNRLQLSEECFLLTSPAAGRVLGLFGSVDTENVFWTPPAFYESPGGWRNLGGDRTWIAPELDFYFPSYPDLRAYLPPREIDPGDYRWMPEQQLRRSESYCGLWSFRKRLATILRIDKCWSRAPRPSGLPGGATFAGYAQNTQLTVLDGNSQVSLWSLAQLPPGGEFIIPVKPAAKLVPYFGEPPQDAFTWSNSTLRLRPGGRGIWKVGLSPSDTNGIAGYAVAGTGQWLLVVRVFQVDPRKEYLDRAWNEKGEPCGEPCALQVCSVSGDLGSYVELEHHSARPTNGVAVDQATLFSVRGSREVIRNAIHSLLGVDWEE